MTGTPPQRLIQHLLRASTQRPALCRRSRSIVGYDLFTGVQARGTQSWRRKLPMLHISFQSQLNQVMGVAFLLLLHYLPLDPRYDSSQLFEVLVSVSPVVVLRPGQENSWQGLVTFLVLSAAAEFLCLHLEFLRIVLLLINWQSSMLRQQSALYNDDAS